VSCGDKTEQPRHARSTDRTEIKLSIGYALSDRFVPIACAIVKNLKRSSNLIEELRAAAVEAIWLTSRRTRLRGPKRLLSAAASIGLCADPGQSPGLPGPGDEQNSTGCFYVGTYGVPDMGLRQEAVGADRIQAYLDRHRHPKTERRCQDSYGCRANLANRGVFAACV
jgi:hypothetical protein